MLINQGCSYLGPLPDVLNKQPLTQIIAIEMDEQDKNKYIHHEINNRNHKYNHHLHGRTHKLAMWRLHPRVCRPSHLLHWWPLLGLRLGRAHHGRPHVVPHHRGPWWALRWASLEMSWRGAVGARGAHSHHAMRRSRGKGGSRQAMSELGWHKGWSRGCWRRHASHALRLWGWWGWRSKP